MATSHSDIDVYVIYDERTRVAWHQIDLPGLDVGTYRLETFSAPALFTDNPDRWWNRYSLTHSRVLIDKLDGRTKKYADAHATLSPDEAAVVLPAALDDYINLAIRSLKSARDARPFESRLDAVESIGYALLSIYSLERRIRRFNKYLRWDLEHFPLGNPEFEAGRLLELLGTIQSESSPGAQRALFSLIEETARRNGLGGVIDSWGNDLRVFSSPL